MKLPAAFLALILVAMSTAFASSAGAAVKTERIEYKVGDAVLEGVLAYDDAIKDKKPGVLVCPEWWGCNDYAEKRAKDLAGLGYVAFAIDVYGKGKTTTDPKQAAAWAAEVTSNSSVVRDRAAAGLKILAEQPRVDSTRMAAIGYCMGGTVAMELARSGLPHTQNLKAVVPFHASTVSAKNPADNANIKGSVLVCTGAADEFVPPGEIDKFQKQMADAKVDFQVLSLGGAVHAFTNPAANGSFSPMVKYNAKADARCWDAMKSLFAETIDK